VKRRALLAGFATSALYPLGQACGPSEIGDRRRELLRSWGESLLLANYAELDLLAAELEARLGELGEDPNETTLLAAQEGWWAARAPWKRSDVFAFGPYSELPDRFGPKLDFWPGRPDTVLETLESDAPLDADGLALLGAPAKGFTALEYLLFEPDLDLVETFATVPRRVEYARALAADLGVQARALAEAWSPSAGNFLGQLVDGGRGSTRYPTLNAALGEIVNRVGFTLENDRLEKLAPPLGDTADGTPEPELVESPWSGRSHQDLRDNLRGIELLFRGESARGVASLDDYLRFRGRHLTPSFDQRFGACQAALDAVPEPLNIAIFDAASEIRKLMAELQALQRFFQVDVINALSLTVGFNDNDGD
jgi:predicted lipoprotein